MDYLFCAFIIIIGFFACAKFTRKSKFPYGNMITFLWVYHLMFGIFYYWYSLSHSADSLHYWKRAATATSSELSEYIEQGMGTPFMYVINYIPANVLQLSYFSGTMLYTFIGFLGLLRFIKIAEILVPYNSLFRKIKLFPLIFFLPNLHFWSVAIGKDTLLFLSIGLFFYGSLQLAKRLPILILSIFLAFMVRPHIMLFLLIGLGLAFLFDSKLAGYKRAGLIIIIIIGGVLILPKVLSYVNIQETSIESIQQRLDSQAELLNQSSGSGVDISSYPFPLKVFSFLYRPFFFDIKGLTGVMASFENLILLILTYRLFKSRPLKTFKVAPFVMKGMLFFMIIGTLIFSQSLGNIGIMIRMKNMFIPGYLIYLLWAFSFQHASRLKRGKLV